MATANSQRSDRAAPSPQRSGQNKAPSSSQRGAQQNGKQLRPKADGPNNSMASSAGPPSQLTEAALASRASFAPGPHHAESFATNIAAAGSFATRAPNSMSFQAGVMGSQRGSFAAQRSDASFAAGLPPSAGCATRVPGSTPAGLTTQLPEGLTTRVPPSSSFATGGLTTQPPPAGLTTQMPLCTSFATGGPMASGVMASGVSFPTQLPSTGSFVGANQPLPSRRGPGMDVIRE